MDIARGAVCGGGRAGEQRGGGGGGLCIVAGSGFSVVAAEFEFQKFDEYEGLAASVAAGLEEHGSGRSDQRDAFSFYGSDYQYGDAAAGAADSGFAGAAEYQDGDFSDAGGRRWLFCGDICVQAVGGQYDRSVAGGVDSDYDFSALVGDCFGWVEDITHTSPRRR